MAVEFTASQLYVPTLLGLPFVLTLDHPQGMFQPVFTTDDKAQAFVKNPAVRAVMAQQGPLARVGIMFVRQPRKFCEIVLGEGVRVMVNPVAESSEQTHWHEVVQRDNKLVYLDTAP